MLYLNKNHLKSLLEFDLIIDGIEEAYDLQENDAYKMPDRMHVNYDDNTLLFMPCILNKNYGTKLVTVFPDNHLKQLPVVDGIMVLNDSKTGVVKSIMDGQMLTAIRTGAVGGTAIKHLSKDSKVLGIIGTGIQGYYQSLFADHVMAFNTICVYDKFKNYDHFKSLYGDRLVICDTANDLVEESDVIITTTTSYEPLFDTENIKGKLFIGIGSFKPDMREYSDDFISKVDTILVDTEFAADESGDLKIPIDEKIISKTSIELFSESRHKNRGETVFFKSVGMALFDVVVAEKLYDQAIKKQLGQMMEG